MNKALAVQADDKIKEIIDIKVQVQGLYFKTAALMFEAKQLLVDNGSKAAAADQYIMERTGYGKSAVGRFLRARVAVLNLEGQGIKLLPASEGMLRELACKALNADAQTQADIWNRVLAKADGAEVTSKMVDDEVYFWKNGVYPLTAEEELELKRQELELKEAELEERAEEIEAEREAAEDEKIEAEMALDDLESERESMREQMKEDMAAEMHVHLAQMEGLRKIKGVTEMVLGLGFNQIEASGSEVFNEENQALINNVKKMLEQQGFEMESTAE